MESSSGRVVLLSVLGIVAGPLTLAALGLTHPSDLTSRTAPYWRDLHIILLPLFPLLGVNLWWLLGDARDPASWLARLAAFVFIAFYSGLDVLAGVAAGAVVAAGVSDVAGATSPLFAQASRLGAIGAGSLVIGTVITGIVLVVRTGRVAVPGAVLLVAGAVLFGRNHIYFPVGVSAMLVMAAGFGWLQWGRLNRAQVAASP
ncbi:MAG: hypothetical protein ACRDZO_22345 [Egibacteraceae bacterium]